MGQEGFCGRIIGTDVTLEVINEDVNKCSIPYTYEFDSGFDWLNITFEQYVYNSSQVGCEMAEYELYVRFVLEDHDNIELIE